MAGARRNWTREETLMAFTLYYLLPQKEIDKKGADVNALARALGRTPDAVALKGWNIAAHDANRVASGKVGMKNGSRLDAAIWEEFAERGDDLILEGVALLEKVLAGEEMSSSVNFAVVDCMPTGGERLVQRTERINQQYFRNCLLRNYKERCCLTGLAVPKLLVASHIKPWKDSDPKTERLAASNGLLLNALHDRAFDQGLITLNRDLEVVVSPKLKRDDASNELLFKYEGRRIFRPLAMPPAREFIEYHNDVIFVA